MMDIRCKDLFDHARVKGHILEIGAGTGINFPCLFNNSNIESYIGIEPNVHMYPYFNGFVAQYPASFEIRLSDQSATDMHEVQSSSIDTVIMTLVFCSIPDPLPEKVLLEVHRILKPGGRFIFFEHTLANPEVNPLTYGFQRAIEPIWAIIGDGCRFKIITDYFDRMKAVYSSVTYEKITMPVPMFFVKYAVKGQLIK